MRKKLQGAKLLYILIGMLILSFLAFTIFYVFLLDVFGLFTYEEQSIGSLPIARDAQDIVPSPSQLDAQSTDAPVHGDVSTDDKYPKEESIVLARSIAQWVHIWYKEHGATDFPVMECVEYIASLRYSEGNALPSVEELPQLLTDTMGIFIDALFTQHVTTKTYMKGLHAYMMTFAQEAIAVLDSMRTMSPLQRKDFIEMIRLTQNIKTLQNELAMVNAQIEVYKREGNNAELPSLAERKFTLQKTKEEQKLVLERYQSIFAPFYSRAEIRNLPPSVTHAIVGSFMEYAPVQTWHSYVISLLQCMQKMKHILGNIEVK